MFRISKVWLLILIQLIAGSGRDTYLCIDSNGTIAGIDAGPQFCTNCDHDHCDHHHDHDSNEACSVDSKSCACCPHCPHVAMITATAEPDVNVTSEHDCDCEHRLISSEHVRSVSRLMRTSHHGDVPIAMRLPSSAKLLRATAFQPVSRHHSPPPSRADSIAVLSTVIIRS